MLLTVLRGDGDRHVDVAVIFGPPAGAGGAEDGVLGVGRPDVSEQQGRLCSTKNQTGAMIRR